MACTIGLVGLGVMGTAILTRLLETGHEVAAFDVNADAVARAVAAGARAAATPAEAAARGFSPMAAKESPRSVNR